MMVKLEEAKVLRVKEKALEVLGIDAKRILSTKHWLPRSQVEIRRHDTEVWVPRWLADAKGLSYWT